MASIEEQCDVVDLGGIAIPNEADTLQLTHARKVLNIELTMTTTELQMPTGCLACVVRNIPLVVSAN